MRLVIALVCALTLDLGAADAWVTTTPGKAGTDDVVPMLEGFGPAVVGSTNNELRISDAYPASTASLVIGLSALGQPFKGGVLGPAPDIVVNGLSVDAYGSIAIPFALPENIPVGFELWIQFWLNEPAPLDRLSATNTLLMTVGKALTFAEHTYAAPGAAHIETADLDNNGALDLVATVGPSLATMMGNGDGTFLEPVAVAPASVDAFGSFDVGEFNDDGVPDVVLPDTQGHGFVLLGDGDGSFSNAVGLAGPGWEAISGAAAFGDLNNDGHTDAVTCSLHWATTSFGVFLYAGTGTSAQPGIELDVGTVDWPSEVAAHDVDADGYGDILILTATGSFKVGLGDAAGDFTMQSFPGIDGWGFAIEVGDATGDGLADIVVATGPVSVVRNSDVTTGHADVYDVGAQDVAIGDVNLDGTPDLVVATNEGVGVLLGRVDGTFCATQLVGGVSTPGATGFDVAVGDFNADGKLDIAATDAVNDSVVILINTNG